MAYTPGQQKCIDTLDRSVVVAAGAGSGKTFTLTKRIVSAIQSGSVDGIGRVCAITFTNKAAAELKSRIKTELRDCGLADQALAVDEAWVSTIHGMCARILRAHALELDLDPKFKMADAALANSLRDRAVDDVLARARLIADSTATQPAGVVEADFPSPAEIDALFAEYPARSFGSRGTSVESMVHLIVQMAASRPDGFDSIAAGGQDPNAPALVDAVLGSFESLADLALAQKPNEAREAWAASTHERIAAIRADSAATGSSGYLWAIKALDSLEWPRKAGSADYKAQVQDALDLYRMCVMELRLAAASGQLAVIVRLARLASARFRELKRAEGVLDNDDLLVLAYGAVTGNPEIAALYSDKFQLVMVDEFQDTDQMQVDMIKALSGPGACRLCTVGDAQQSIYRFRGADVSVYNRHLDQVASEDPESVIRLDDNFRSHSDVLAFVDRVFEQPDVFGGEFMSLAPGHDESRIEKAFPEGRPRIQVQLTSTGYRGASSDELRAAAAKRIACSFAELRQAGYSGGDMALLLGGMTHAGTYAQALRDQGLACVISGGSVFAQCPEAQYVLDLCRVIADPYQTQSLHNVLTGPAFALDADDLLVLCTAWDDVSGKPRKRNLASGLIAMAYQLRSGQAVQFGSAQLVSALRIMGDAIDAAGRSQASRIVWRVLLESGLLSRLEAGGAEGLASAANYYKALRMVEAIESAGACGPSGVAAALEASLSESKEAPGALSTSSGDFVRIMTVHASKGLEFPVVGVAEFKGSAGSSGKLLAAATKGKVHLSLDLCNTVAQLEGRAALKDLPGLYAQLMEGRAGEDELERAIEHASGALELRSAMYEHDREGESEEAKRLLYVALTRAKEALVVSLLGKSSKENPHASPKGCMGAVVTALAGQLGGFDEGVSRLPFGGSADALVEHIVVAGGNSADAETTVRHAPESAEGPSGAGAPLRAVVSPLETPGFMVPLPLQRPRVSRMPFAPAHSGVFSYSAVAESSHEGDLLERLAGRYFEGADPGAQPDSYSLFLVESPRVEGAGEVEPGARGRNKYAATADEDDGAWAYLGTSCADSDKATDFGTAFHRLAQLAVGLRGARISAGGPGALEKPAAERVDSAARSSHLDDFQRRRLDGALDAWFASDVAARAACFDDLRAEVPFMVQLPQALVGEGVYLEGEIDLLAVDDRANRALIVDYKTGGRDDEQPDDLGRKHILQACCYALAVLRQGFGCAEAVFVRVERSRAGAPGQPQRVSYRFSESDLADLERGVAEAYALAGLR